jgi:hypothetical protein
VDLRPSVLWDEKPGELVTGLQIRSGHAW